MENYNIIETEIITQLIDKAELSNAISHCYRRPNIDSHQKEQQTFPDNEEPKVIGHGNLLHNNDNNIIIVNRIKDTTNSNTNINKLRTLLNFENAPEHLQFNPYILTGYRTYLPTKFCIQSMFWWTNETINIWSHLFGYLLFVALTIKDFQFLNEYATTSDKIICGSLLFCFQLCMLLSTIYHTFSCRSAKEYDRFLTIDIFGIALVLLAIYISAMYYAFYCHESLQKIYSLTVLLIFAGAMIIQVPQLNVSGNAKIAVFLAWALFGIVPTTHWIYEMGGFSNPMVKLLFPRVIVMYLICGIAFVIYLTKIPERWMAGKVDYIGHSHNLWHLFILGALYWWHDTGYAYAEFRVQNGCCNVVKYYS